MPFSHKLAYEHDQLNDAEQYLKQCIDLCRQWGDHDFLALAWGMLARLEETRGKPEAAREALREAERLSGEHALFPRRKIQLIYEMARTWLAQGQPRKIRSACSGACFIDQG